MTHLESPETRPQLETDHPKTTKAAEVETWAAFTRKKRWKTA
jgi:hypothetical protein